VGDLRAAAGSDRGVTRAGTGEAATFSPDDARDVLERLARAGCVAADQEADELLTAAPDMTTLMAWVARRGRGEPLAWITGRTRFLGTGMRHDRGGPRRPPASCTRGPTDAMRLLPPDVTRYEPALALDGGEDGLEEVRRLVVGAARLLRRDGWLLTEIGGNQDVSIAHDLRAAGFRRLTFWCDPDGDLRGLAAQLG
jgi:methylase of polypeptide subunit release factors